MFLLSIGLICPSGAQTDSGGTQTTKHFSLGRPKQFSPSSSLPLGRSSPPGSFPTREAWEAALWPHMMKLKATPLQIKKSADKDVALCWFQSHLEVVDFLRFGCPVAFLQRGSPDQWGELGIGEQFKWLPESGWGLLWPHPHPQSCCQNILLIGLSLGLLHQRPLFLVNLVGLFRWHSGAAVSQLRWRKKPSERSKNERKTPWYSEQVHIKQHYLHCSNKMETNWWFKVKTL